MHAHDTVIHANRDHKCSSASSRHTQGYPYGLSNRKPMPEWPLIHPVSLMYPRVVPTTLGRCLLWTTTLTALHLHRLARMPRSGTVERGIDQGQSVGHRERRGCTAKGKCSDKTDLPIGGSYLQGQEDTRSSYSQGCMTTCRLMGVRRPLPYPIFETPQTCTQHCFGNKCPIR